MFVQIEGYRILWLEKQARSLESSIHSRKAQVSSAPCLHDCRKAARQLLTLDSTDERRIFEGI